MWKSFFLATGIILCILCAECLAVQKFVLKPKAQPIKAASLLPGSGQRPAPAPPRVITPRDWAPWSLMATGAVVCLYSFTIPRRMAGK